MRTVNGWGIVVVEGGDGRGCFVSFRNRGSRMTEIRGNDGRCKRLR
jgi:hypothetical protein